jgi:hypothetical protein
VIGLGVRISPGALENDMKIGSVVEFIDEEKDICIHGIGIVRKICPPFILCEIAHCDKEMSEIQNEYKVVGTVRGIFDDSIVRVISE